MSTMTTRRSIAAKRTTTIGLTGRQSLQSTGDGIITSRVVASGQFAGGLQKHLTRAQTSPSHMEVKLSPSARSIGPSRADMSAACGALAEAATLAPPAKQASITSANAQRQMQQQQTRTGWMAVARINYGRSRSRPRGQAQISTLAHTILIKAIVCSLLVQVAISSRSKRCRTTSLGW